MEGWWLAFWVGLGGCGWLALHTVVTHRLRPMLRPRLPRKQRPPPLCEDEIIPLLASDIMEGGESAEWLNDLLSLGMTEFVAMAGPLRDKLVLMLRRMVVDATRRSWLGLFVEEAELVDWTLGETFPELQDLRWVQRSDSGNALLAGNLAQTGPGLTIVAKLRLIGGWTCYLRIGLEGLEGPVSYPLNPLSPSLSPCISLCRSCSAGWKRPFTMAFSTWTVWPLMPS